MKNIIKFNLFDQQTTFLLFSLFIALFNTAELFSWFWFAYTSFTHIILKYIGMYISSSCLIPLKTAIIWLTFCAQKYKKVFGYNTVYEQCFFYTYFIIFVKSKALWNPHTLLSSIYIRRKNWIRENFRHVVFEGFTCFETSWTRFDHF